MKSNCSPLVSLPPNPWSCDYFLGFVILGPMGPREMPTKEGKLPITKQQVGNPNSQAFKPQAAFRF